MSSSATPECVHTLPVLQDTYVPVLAAALTIRHQRSVQSTTRLDGTMHNECPLSAEGKAARIRTRKFLVVGEKPASSGEKSSAGGCSPRWMEKDESGDAVLLMRDIDNNPVLLSNCKGVLLLYEWRKTS